MFSAFANIVKWLTARGANSRKKPKERYFPVIEFLESRELLAVYIWNPMAGSAVWGNGNNWIDENGARYALNALPQQADELRFSGASNADSTDNISNGTFARLEITNQFTGTITLNSNLTAKAGFINNGTITGAFTLSIDSTSTNFVWAGGTLSTSYVSIGSGTTFNVDPVSQTLTSVSLTNSQLDNNGTINVVSGTITQTNSSINNLGDFKFLQNAVGINSTYNPGTHLPTSNFTNVVNLEIAANTAMSPHQVGIQSSFIDWGNITIPDATILRLGGGGLLNGSVSLGGNTAGLVLDAQPLGNETENFKYSYHITTGSIIGTGSLNV